MSFRLVDSDWNSVMTDAVRNDHSAVRIVCPFIKKEVIDRLLAKFQPGLLQVITRFNLNDFAEGVSDLAALRSLMGHGAMIRGIRNLHAKLYLFGASRAIVTSANLTKAALDRNHEFGFVAEDAEIVGHCRRYFDDLWGRAGSNLTTSKLAKWEQTVTQYLASGARPAVVTGLKDVGVDADLAADPIELPVFVEEAPAAFVKFFGESDNRASRSMDVFEEVRRSGCHRTCTYPKGKRPRQVRDGAILFMGRIVKDPNDILIYGRAVGMRHVPGRDDATPEDISLRSWKESWPHYVRVHHAEFLAGTLSNGVSLNVLMDELKFNAFVPTQRNAAKGSGNTDPRKTYRQQAAVELTTLATAWMNDRLQKAFLEHGTLATAILEKLDWPQVSRSD